ncbi:MAG: DoxX family protein [Phycisphaerales bacterium]
MNKNPRPLGWLVLSCRVVIAGLFLFAAVMKLQNIPAFALAIQAFRIIPDHAGHLTKFGAYFVPWLEIVAAGMLLLGVWTRAAAAMICVLLLAFLGMIIAVMVRGIDTTCSCFGKLDLMCSGAIGPCHVVRNTILFMVTGVVVVLGPGPLTFDRREVK